MVKTLSINGTYGGAWYVTNGTPNGVPDAENQRVLFMQLTTSGTLSGVMNAQIFENGDGDFEVFKTFAFDGPGTYSAEGESENGVGNACGCMDPAADNFDFGATYDNGDCVYFGCTDASACNYDDSANTDDETCWYAESGYDCNGACLNDADADGVCDEFEVAGCQDAMACNYDADATDEDGSCLYVCRVPGTTVTEIAWPTRTATVFVMNLRWLVARIWMPVTTLQMRQMMTACAGSLSTSMIVRAFA